MTKAIYKTSDFLTASVLLLLKHRLLSTDNGNPHRVVFLFEDSNRLQKDILSLQRSELQVNPTDLWAAERRCKQIIYGEGRL